MVALARVSVSRERETRPEEVFETSSRGEHAEGDAPRLRAGSSDANNRRREKTRRLEPPTVDLLGYWCGSVDPPSPFSR